jgi:hypothetical protein
MILGLISSNIPFTDHNQSPRGIFQYNQARQAMGLYISDYRERTDISYILYHTQIPIITSRASKYTGSHIFPAGENCIVAIASYTGYNQEDSLLMNNSAIEKGLFRAQKLQKYFEAVTKNPASSQTSIFMKPDSNKVDIFKDINYDKLTEEGYVKPETVIVDGDVIIGMVVPKPFSKENEKPYKDSSTEYKSLVPGAIDKVITGENSDGYPIIKLRVRSERIPDVGDKFSSRHGQKGTIGYKPHRADLMFSKSGLIPDIIINPNAITKRMTIGQLIECLQSKVCAIKGVYGDATPFTGVNLEEMNDFLIKNGYEEWGNETMYNGRNGQKIETKIFIGPTYYQRLKQIVSDKAHCLSMDTEVLTFEGWKNYNKLTLNDKVASLIDGKLIYQNPRKLLYYPGYCGSMYSIESKNINLLVTLNHKMWVSRKREEFRFEIAEDIIGEYREYQKNAVWDIEDYKLIINNFFVETNLWLVIFGNWISNGNIDELNRVVLMIKPQIISSLVNIGAKYIIKNNNIIIEDSTINNYFISWKNDKIFPDWIWSLSSNQARVLLNNIVDSRICYDTDNEQLVDNLMRLALHCGWSANKTQYNNLQLNTYRIEIVKKGTCAVNDGTFQKEEIIDNYKNPVFCLEIEGGIFYVRRNGKGVWTGNSRARGPVQLLTRQPTEGRSRNGGLRLGEMERDALCAQGTALLLRERNLDNSDIYTFHVCDICGLIAHKVPGKKYYMCNSCKNTTRITKVVSSYAFKLLLQELRSINILGRIRTPKSIITSK